MDTIYNFFVEQIKEVHIVDHIFKFYYEDWEETRYKRIKGDLYKLNKSFGLYYIELSKQKMEENKRQIRKLETELAFLNYRMIRKYENICQEIDSTN